MRRNWQGCRSGEEGRLIHAPESLGFHETAEKDHGRIKTRKYWQSDRLDPFEDWSRARAGFAAENLATLCRHALHLLKRRPPRNAASGANKRPPDETTPFSSAFSVSPLRPKFPRIRCVCPGLSDGSKPQGDVELPEGLADAPAVGVANSVKPCDAGQKILQNMVAGVDLVALDIRTAAGEVGVGET